MVADPERKISLLIVR